jgi:hypothetical protein
VEGGEGDETAPHKRQIFKKKKMLIKPPKRAPIGNFFFESLEPHPLQDFEKNLSNPPLWIFNPCASMLEMSFNYSTIASNEHKSRMTKNIDPIIFGNFKNLLSLILSVNQSFKTYKI